MANKKSAEKTASAPETENTNGGNAVSLEDAFAELDELIKDMDDDKISLEDSFKNYKKGLELIKLCNDSIGRIEGELEVLESGD